MPESVDSDNRWWFPPLELDAKMRALTEFEKAVNKLRVWQRRNLLRQYGENGLVLPKNIELSQALDIVINEAAPGAATSDSQ